MNVIRLYRQLQHLYLFPFTQRSDIAFQQFFDRPVENAKAVLRNPDNVVIAFVDHMR